MALTFDEQKSLVKSYLDNFELYASKCLTIKNHVTATLVPLILNRGQKILHAVVEKQKSERGYVRIILDKTRRFGGSTYVEGRFYHKTSMNFNRSAFIVAHEEDSTNTLFSMARLFHERNPIAPQTRYSSKKELLFDTPKGTGLKSEYSLACARNTDAGRSQGIHYLHGCLAADTPAINGDTGALMPMGDFSVGDTVRTHKGNLAKISFISKKERNAKKIQIKGLTAFPLVATSEHQFWTPLGWKKLSDLQEGDRIGFPVVPITDNGISWSFRLPASARPQGGGSGETGPDTTVPSYALGRVLGLYLAEGCIIKQNKHPRHPSAVTLSVHEREVERTTSWLSEIKDLYRSHKISPDKNSKTVRITVYGRSFAVFIKSHCGELDSKMIPIEWSKCGPDFCRGLVHGYLVGDGHSSKHPNDRRISAPSIRAAITVGMRDLLASLGYGWACIYHQKAANRHERNEREQWILRLSGCGVDKIVSELCWGIPARQRKGFGEVAVNDGYAWLPINDISDAGRVETVDFAVDHEDHSYCILHAATHNSEVAFWPDADTLLDGIMACVPPPPAETEIFLESTGNGFGNRFQRDVFKIYQEGKHPYYQEDGITYAWMSPCNEWVLVFIPWFAHDIYRREFQDDGAREEFERDIRVKVLNREWMIWEESEARKLQKKYSLSLEQLHWREWAIENIFKGQIEKFRQEFPATVEESFLSRGSNVYPKELCDDLSANCRPPVYVGDIVERMGKAQIKLNQYGSVSLWEKPNFDDSYFFTIDPGGGLKDSQKKEKREPDPTCMDMWNRKTGKQAAQWHGDIDYDLIADTAELFGRLYGHYEDGEAPIYPLACVEIQNHGFTVVADLKRKKYPMYEAKDGEPGWLTTSRSKPQMVDSLLSCARDGSLQIMCSETVAEMRTYTEERGKFGGENGCHDDRVMSAAMASQMMLLLPVNHFKPVHGKNKKIGGFSNWHNRAKDNRWDSGYIEIYIP